MKWDFRTDNVIVSTPLIHKEIAFIGSWDGYLYAISLKKQELLWKFRTIFEKLNFDVSAASRHIETQEEKSKEIFSVWKPETSVHTRQKTKQTYGKDASIGDVSNVMTYGEHGDEERFSYVSSNPYENKRMYKAKKSGYK